MATIHLGKEDQFGFTTESHQIRKSPKSWLHAESRRVMLSCSDSVRCNDEEEYYNTVDAFSVSPDNELYSVVDGVLFSKDGSCLIAFPPRREGQYSIPEGVVRVGEGAFAHCSLNMVSFPDSLQAIGNDAFCHCNAITCIQLPDHVSEIGPRTFAFCKNLKSVTLPENLVTIESQLFFACDNLSQVVVKRGLRFVATTAFDLCPLLQSLTIPESGFDASWSLDCDHRFCDVDELSGSWAWYIFLMELKEHPLSRQILFDEEWFESEPQGNTFW